MIIKHEIWQKEQGSALSSVLIISVIILTFIGAILSGIVLQARFIQKNINQTKALYLAEQQVYEYLAKPHLNHTNIKATFQSGYERLVSIARVGNLEAVLQVLVGNQEIPSFQLSTVVLDINNALTLTGNTALIGDYAISNNSITTSSFRGFPFRGTLDGTRLEDTETVDLELTKYFEQVDWYEVLFEGSRLNRFAFHNKRAIQTQLVEQDTLYVSESLELELNDVPIRNPFVLIVEGNLTLSGTTELPDYAHIIVSDSLLIEGGLTGSFIQLYAEDYIRISENTMLSAQVLSEGTIEVGDQAYLTYPSVLISSKEAYAGGGFSSISVNDQSIIDGTIMYPIKPNLINREQLKVTIDTAALVRGVIYTQGLTELFGTVHGTIITDQFYFYESPTSYFNWIKDATIDRTQRPKDFVIPFGFSDSASFEILDWRIIK